MIPKIIHYCWFGYNTKPDLIQKCIDSWKKFCPDFEIIEWNESNSHRFQNKFYKQAIQKKQYAFAADYIRFCVLNEYGGIYLDTDMLVLNKLDGLLSSRFFISKEDDFYYSFGIIGSVPFIGILEIIIKAYNIDFDYFKRPVIPRYLKEIVDKSIRLNENFKIYPTDYFYAFPYDKRHQDFNQYLTKNSIAVHLWNESWNYDKKHLKTSYTFTLLYDILFNNYSLFFFIKYFSQAVFYDFKQISRLIRLKFY